MAYSLPASGSRTHPPLLGIARFRQRIPIARPHVHGCPIVTTSRLGDASAVRRISILQNPGTERGIRQKEMAQHAEKWLVGR